MIRYRTRRNPGVPKGPKFTPEQEREMQRTEEMLDRARIYKYGVQHFLENETGARQIAVNILQEAVLLQKDAYGTRASIRNAADLKRGPETKIQEEEISPGSPGPRFNQK